MMTKEEIGRAMDPNYPGVYIPTTEPTKLIFDDGVEIVGYFDYTKESDKLQSENKYTFVEFNNSQQYRSTKDHKYVTIVDGNKLVFVEYPAKKIIIPKRETNAVIEIIPKLSIPIIEKLFNELESFKKLDKLVDLKLPKSFDNADFGLLFSFLQFVTSWVRAKVSGNLLLPVADDKEAISYLQQEFVYPVIALSWEREILDNTGNNLRSFLKMPSQEYFRGMEYFQLKEKLSVPIFCFDHDKRKSGHSRHFYDESLNLLPEDIVSNNLYPAFKKIGSFNKSVFNKCIKEKYDSFIAIIHELFANTHEHAKTDEKGFNLYPNIRSVYLKFHKKTIPSFLTTYKDFTGLKEYFGSKFELNPLGELYLIEFSFLDSGPGLIRRYTGSKNKLSENEEVEIIKKCLYRHNTSATGIKSTTKGIGLDRVLQTIDKNGFVRIKTGHVDVFRNMKKVPYNHEDNSTKIALYDTRLNTDDRFSRNPETQGTLISILFALDYRGL